MAIIVNVDNLVASLAGAGYKNISKCYDQLKAFNVQITATFTQVKASMPNGDKYTTELPSSPATVVHNVHNKVLVTPFVITLNSFFGAMLDLASGVEVKDPNVEIAHAGSDTPFYAQGKTTSDKHEAVAIVAQDLAKDTDFSVSHTVEKKDGNVGIIGKMIKQGLGQALTAGLGAHAEVAQSIAQQKLFVDCGSIVCGQFDENMMHLHLTEELLHPVYGSSNTSTYYCIALCSYDGDKVNVGIRVVSSDDANYTVSLRFEWHPSTHLGLPLKHALEQNGYTVKAEYASIHFTVPKADTVRAITAMVYCMPIEYHQTAQLSFLG